MSVDLTKLGVQELRKVVDDAARLLEKARLQHKKELASRWRSEDRSLEKARRFEASSLGIDYEDILKEPEPRPRRAIKGKPRYKDPVSGRTWTGRGRVPAWVTEREKSGGSREDLAVQPGTRAKRRAARPGVPRYRDPATGKTWTGRGRIPLWVLAHEKAGGSREDLAIGAAVAKPAVNPAPTNPDPNPDPGTAPGTPMIPTIG